LLSEIVILIWDWMSTPTQWDRIGEHHEESEVRKIGYDSALAECDTKTSASKDDVSFLTISDEDEGLSDVPKLKDATACHLKISNITPPAWKNHLDNYMDLELLDLHDQCYARGSHSSSKGRPSSRRGGYVIIHFIKHQFPFLQTSSIPPSPPPSNLYISSYPNPTTPGTTLPETNPPNSPPTINIPQHSSPNSLVTNNPQNSLPNSPLPTATTTDPAIQTPNTPSSPIQPSINAPRLRPSNLQRNPKQRVLFDPSAYTTIITFTEIEPTTFVSANKSPKWQADMTQEYAALMRNVTWSLVPPIPNANVVDYDIILTGNNSDAIDKIIKNLSQTFSIQDLGTLLYFLGVEVVHRNSDVILSQKKYILELLQRVNFSKAKPVPCLITTTANLHLNDSPLFDDSVKYRQLVGALQILCYLRGTSNYGLHIKHNLGSVLHAYTDSHDSSLSAFSDADWTGCPDDQSEYKALADTLAELTWIEALLRELKVLMTCVPVLWCDNLGTTYSSANHVFHARTKHVEVDFHFVREKVIARKLLVQFITAYDQIADIFGKPLSSQRFAELRSKLRLRFSLPERESVDDVIFKIMDVKFRTLKYRSEMKLFGLAANRLNELNKADNIMEDGEQEMDYTEDDLLQALYLIEALEYFMDHQWQIARGGQVHIHTTGAHSFAWKRDEHKVLYSKYPNDVVFFRLAHTMLEWSFVIEGSGKFMAQAKRELSRKTKVISGSEPVDHEVEAEIARDVIQKLRPRGVTGHGAE
ncbi:uncharacterized mitochondrial protein-like protein, partial [Tanacetum coccineum]